MLVITLNHKFESTPWGLHWHMLLHAYLLLKSSVHPPSLTTPGIIGDVTVGVSPKDGSRKGEKGERATRGTASIPKSQQEVASVGKSLP